MKKLIVFFLTCFILLNLTGCEAVRRKFTRKRKEPVKMPRIYQTKSYETRPSPQIYKKHYAYWASWQSELIRVLGQNHKKDMRCIEEIVGNLNDMRNILVKEKGEELDSHIKKMENVKEIIFNDSFTQSNKDYVRRTLEREERFIKREFSFAKVKGQIRKSFDDELQTGG